MDKKDYGISEALPRLSKVTVEKLVIYLRDEIQVEQIGLEEVQEEDLTKDKLLGTRPAKMLIEYWKKLENPTDDTNNERSGKAPRGGIKISTKGNVGQSNIAERDMNETISGNKAHNFGAVGGDFIAGNKSGHTYQGKVENVTYGDNTQLDGSRDTYLGEVDRTTNTYTYGDNAKVKNKKVTYHGSVDKSKGKTTYGDHAQIGGTRNIRGAGEDYLHPSSEDYYLVDDPGLEFADPNSMFVQKIDEKIFKKHFSLRDVYKIRKWGQNRALIINIIDTPGSKRNFADKDTQRLKTLLPQLGFDVVTHENITKPQIEACIREFLSSPKTRDASAFLVYIGSHGGRENGTDFFMDIENRRVYVPDVIKIFDDPQYLADLAEKPKIFLLQFCRKEKEAINNDEADDSEEEFEYFDPGKFIEWFKDQQKPNQSVGDEDDDTDVGISLNDMFVGCATIPGTSAKRNREVGSWFVYAVGVVFCKHAKNNDLESLFKKVRENMQQKAEEKMKKRKDPINIAEEPFSSLGKKMCFYPH